MSEGIYAPEAAASDAAGVAAGTRCKGWPPSGPCPPRSSRRPEPQAYNRKVMTGVAVGLPLSFESEAAGVVFSG